MIIHPQESQINAVFPDYGKTCPKSYRMIFEKERVIEMIYCIWLYADKTNELIQLLKVRDVYHSQICLKYFKSLNLLWIRSQNWFFWYPGKHSWYQKIDISFPIRCSKDNQSSFTCRVIVFENYFFSYFYSYVAHVPVFF